MIQPDSTKKSESKLDPSQLRQLSLFFSMFFPHFSPGFSPFLLGPRVHAMSAPNAQCRSRVPGARPRSWNPIAENGGVFIEGNL